MADNSPSDDNTTPKNAAELSDDRKAAAGIIQADIDRIYSGEDAPHAEIEKELQEEAHQQSAPEEVRSESHGDLTADSQAAQWKQYHSSWQSYYQQYYERYYLNNLHQAKKELDNKDDAAAPKQVIGSQQNETDSSEDKAVHELRDQLLDTVKQRAGAVRKSRQFAPIATALVFALVFVFLQYNRFFFATAQAYVSPGSINPQNVIVDPGASTKVGAASKLAIPKINVEAPVIYGVPSSNVNAVESNLHNGVVHYPITSASSLPGQNGPTVILGHSSNDVFDNGNYKFVFVQLKKLQPGDTFSINYKGTRYTYSVKKKEIIDPTQINKVQS
ncbi:MAG: sortase, partial [Segetibacter sp.]